MLLDTNVVTWSDPFSFWDFFLFSFLLFLFPFPFRSLLSFSFLSFPSFIPSFELRTYAETNRLHSSMRFGFLVISFPGLLPLVSVPLYRSTTFSCDTLSSHLIVSPRCRRPETYSSYVDRQNLFSWSYRQLLSCTNSKRETADSVVTDHLKILVESY